MADALEVVVRLGDSILDVAYVADHRYTLAGETLVLEPGMVVRRGLVEVIARSAKPPTKQVPLVWHNDRRALTYIVASLTAHVIVWELVPPPPPPEPKPEPVTELQLRRPAALRAVRIPPRAVEQELGDSPAASTNGAGSPSYGAAGAAGGESRKTSGAIQIAQRTTDPQIARASAMERARYAGILASNEVTVGFEAITGTADLSSGFDRNDVRAPLYGREGAAGGSFGLARGGLGDGAGCLGAGCSGIIGTGRYGTLSNGTEQSGNGWGGGRGGMRGRNTSVPTVMMCGMSTCSATGALDKSIVRRYIQREIAKVTYCYERELIAHPELDGSVETDFLIGPDGRVVESTATGVSDAVASCVAGVMRNIVFPRAPERGGSTRVHYPFVFRRAGS